MPEIVVFALKLAVTLLPVLPVMAVAAWVFSQCFSEMAACEKERVLFERQSRWYHSERKAWIECTYGKKAWSHYDEIRATNTAEKAALDA